ncbi:MAG: response regulator transcription factor [Candidatus Tyrphobacter sp.]
MPPSHIVVAEDDASIRELVAHHFEREGYAVVGVEDGYAALRAGRESADVLLLDLGLPGLDGFEVARTLRSEGHGVPIVVLTARSDEIDRVVGLELGADDYVCKPFSPRELVARVKALLRRSGTAHAEIRVWRFGRLEIDEHAREARVDGRTVTLKPREYALLAVLAQNAGVALSRERLLTRAWGFDFAGDERTVDVHVRRLRAKLEEPFHLPPLVETLHGFGYKFHRS